jgi:hypothetical protein
MTTFGGFTLSMRILEQLLASLTEQFSERRTAARAGFLNPVAQAVA